jgi:hypothetical protein
MQTQLPYPFDLFFDIKNVQQLRRFYLQICEDKSLIEDLCEKYNVTLPNPKDN